MELIAVAKRVSNVLQFAFADGVERSLSGIRRSSAIGGALMYSMNGKNNPCLRKRPLYGVNPLLGGSVIGGSTVYELGIS